MAEKVSLVIDGKSVSVPSSITIFEAAEGLGIEIPVMCHVKGVIPSGFCRICSVEIETEGKAKMVASCNTGVQEGMKIVTSNEKIITLRKKLIETFLNRSTSVPLLQKWAKKYGMDVPGFEEIPNECIQCGLCVRTCKELTGADVFGYEEGSKIPVPQREEKCIVCGACAHVCPSGYIRMEDEEGRKLVHSEIQLGPNRAIYVPTLQAVPNIPVIDVESCIHFKTGKCGVCASVCPTGAVDYSQKEEEIEIEVGNIILATGYKLFDCARMPEYGYGKYGNVLTSMEFERMCCASGPTGGKIFKEDGIEPKSVVMIHCIGSRDINYHEYCSRVCCMYSLKYAHLIKEKIPHAEVFNCYIDLRCFGKGYEEFYNRLLEEGVRFIRGKPSAVSDYPVFEEEKGKLIVIVEDTLMGEVKRIPVEMVVLGAGIEAGADTPRLARIFSCSEGRDGFFIEKHPKLAPVNTATDGVYIAGTAQGPKDIPDTVAQGGAAASAVLSAINKKQVEIEAATAFIDEEKCSGCKICNSLCPYNAIEFDEEKHVSRVNDALCKACGTCVAACPSAAINNKQFSDKQIMAEIEGVLL